MIRRFNYTSRSRIQKSDVIITFDTSTKPLSFDAQLNFDKYSFDPMANVFIEVYRGNSFMRFHCGTVGNIDIPSNCDLSEIEGAEFARFRVKVVEKKSGKLIAFSSTLTPNRGVDEDKQRESLLPLDVTTDLNSQIWKVKFENEGIRLQVNNRIKGIGNIEKDKGFQSLIFPAVVREVLTHIIYVERYRYDREDEDSPWNKWLKFIKDFYPEEYPGPYEENSDEQDLTNWIDEAVEAFCSKNKVKNSYENSNRWRLSDG